MQEDDKTQEDYKLIQQFKLGDEDALGEMIAKYRPLIVSLISENRSLCTSEIAFEDLYQECNIVLYRSMLSYDKKFKASFYTYYTRAIHNFFCQQYRKKAALKRQAILHDDDNKYLEVLENYAGINYSKTLTPENICILKEEFNHIYTHLNAKEKYVLTRVPITDKERRIYYKCKSKFKKYLDKNCL